MFNFKRNRRICDVCGARINNDIDLCSICKSDRSEKEVITVNGIYFERNTYCKIIVTTKRLVAMSDYKSLGKMGVIGALEDYKTPCPLIDIELKSIDNLEEREVRKRFASYMVVILELEDGMGYSFRSLPRWFTSKLKRCIALRQGD